MESNEKRSYFFNITEVKDNKTYEVMNFNFGGHHDLSELAEQAKKLNLDNDAHAKELALGIRLLHHALKKNLNVEVLNNFWPAFEAFKKEYEALTK